MRHLLLLSALVPCVLLGLSLQSTAQDSPGTFAEPSIINPTWEFELEVKNPQPIAVPDAKGRMVWYWYLPYKVINNTNEDRLFIPEVSVVDNHGRIVTAGRQIPQNVYPAIAERLGNDLLESPDDVLGRLLQGEDFAKESVAIWPASQKDVDEFTVFFAGADGETKQLISPSTGKPVLRAAIDPITGEPVLDSEGNPVLQPVMVRRTRAYTYTTPGTLTSNNKLRQQPVRLVGETVVMR
ncbi:hypothetical protein [Algisphaera agarilytica]|uniref:Uncharacterized protein n=1 Tax=Algisphaera agarilytica TaxID=1385975 RepID=A0A7X0H664_9BACT|nr:hypothetical protein [Algisphaera agarilytica]MBB6429995.1 hypothetical protein [Algisphaera agarilytica]